MSALRCRIDRAGNLLDRAGRGRRSTRDRRPEGPVVALVRALLLFEASLYSAVTPVLPHYAHVLGASKPAVGLLTASYPAGLIPGSFLGGWLAVRSGVRRTTLVGLLVFAVSAVAFGFGSDIVALDALRFVQGVASGCIWGGGLTWVICVAPRERRGEVFGSTIGAAILGTLLGPVLGTLAVAIGTGVVFTLVGAASILLALWTARYPEPPRPETTPRTSLRSLVGNPRIMLGFWLILLEACTVGATATLLPLRLAHFGASGIVIGGTFLLTSLLSFAMAPPIGRIVDRRGSGFPLTIGLITTAILLALLPVPHSTAMLVILTVAALGPPLTAYTIPAMAVMTAAAERAGIAVALATMLLNLAWAFGETIGAPVAANLSQATSDAVPLVLLAAIMLITLGPVRRARLGREVPPNPEPGQDPGQDPTPAPEQDAVPAQDPRQHGGQPQDPEHEPPHEPRVPVSTR
jgi:MFS family permease